MFGRDLVNVILIILGVLGLLWLLGGLVCLWVVSMCGFRGDGRGGIVVGIVFFGPFLLLGILYFVGLSLIHI